MYSPGDPSLEAAIEGLKASRRKHNSILRLTRESAAAAAQLGKNFALMADLFGDLTLKEREDLRGDYGNLTHLTRGLSRETDKFLAGIGESSMTMLSCSIKNFVSFLLKPSSRTIWTRS